ncbi:MAG: tyrosine--tRNA ligase [Candidatus Makana argininalis]
MKKTNIIEELDNRNLIYQITDKKYISNILLKKKISLYCGFDPTSDSLHVGHLLVLLCLKHFQLLGHRPIVLIGSSTALIGDPSFKNIERNFNNFEKINTYVKKIKIQISMFLNFNCGNNSAIILDNKEWFNKINIIDFLNKTGKHFSVNKMISKEIIKNRLFKNKNSISFSEFSYNLLQSYDFSYLYKKYNVKLQIGGSDQWGNITSGIFLTHKLYKKKVYGLTVPIITNSNGIKFSKTSQGTIWLDKNKTSIYKFYQFWINIPDSDLLNFLKLFNLINNIKIKKIDKKYKYENNFLNYKKKILAEEITKIVHGKIGLKCAKRITYSLFKNKVINLTENDFKQLYKDGIKTIDITQSYDLQQILKNSNLAKSRNQARILIISNSISINGIKQNNPEYILNKNDILYGKFTIIQKGKKKHCLLNWKKKFKKKI